MFGRFWVVKKNTLLRIGEKNNISWPCQRASTTQSSPPPRRGGVLRPLSSLVRGRTSQRRKLRGGGTAAKGSHSLPRSSGGVKGFHPIQAVGRLGGQYIHRHQPEPAVQGQVALRLRVGRAQEETVGGQSQSERGGHSNPQKQSPKKTKKNKKTQVRFVAAHKHLPPSQIVLPAVPILFAFPKTFAPCLRKTCPLSLQFEPCKNLCHQGNGPLKALWWPLQTFPSALE